MSLRRSPIRRCGCRTTMQSPTPFILWPMPTPNGTVRSLPERRDLLYPTRDHPVKCELHSWMRGVLADFKNSHHTVTGSNGAFTLPNLPRENTLLPHGMNSTMRIPKRSRGEWRRKQGLGFRLQTHTVLKHGQLRRAVRAVELWWTFRCGAVNLTPLEPPLCMCVKIATMLQALPGGLALRSVQY
jgi:hypothetical protein